MSFYGNVPEEDVAALQNAVRIASNVIARLPALSPPTWRETAYELVLSGILDDWVANGTNELDDEDEEDLSNLLRVAADLALSQEEILRDAAFQTLLRSAMHDWVENWNAEE
jgi:hypothetical protein